MKSIYDLKKFKMNEYDGFLGLLPALTFQQALAFIFKDSPVPQKDFSGLGSFHIIFLLFSISLVHPTKYLSEISVRVVLTAL